MEPKAWSTRCCKCGVDTCFANPGTSEMHFVAALDRIAGMRCVLCLQENVVTGAADGYYRDHRQAGRDAAALRAGPRERPGEPAQRAARTLRHRQRGRRPGDLSPPARRAADRRRRRLGAAGLDLGAHRRCRPNRVGEDAAAAVQAARVAAGRHRDADPAERHVVGRRRRGRHAAARVRRAAGRSACGAAGRARAAREEERAAAARRRSGARSARSGSPGASPR